MRGSPTLCLRQCGFASPWSPRLRPGTTEAVIDGQTGLLVPVGDPMLLARAIRDVVRDPAFGQTAGRAGRAHVEITFRADAMVTQFARAIRAHCTFQKGES